MTQGVAVGGILGFAVPVHMRVARAKFTPSANPPVHNPPPTVQRLRRVTLWSPRCGLCRSDLSE